MKPSNSNDRINLNRIPHPEEDDHLRSVGWVTDDDYTGVVGNENASSVADSVPHAPVRVQGHGQQLLPLHASDDARGAPILLHAEQDKDSGERVRDAVRRSRECCLSEFIVARRRRDSRDRRNQGHGALSGVLVCCVTFSPS